MARNLRPEQREARLEAIRRQNAADARRARLLTTVAVGLVVLLAVGVGLAVWLSARDGGGGDSAGGPDLVLPAGTTPTDPEEPLSGGFLVGEAGDVRVVVFEDYQCPACRAFEAEAGEYLAGLAAGDEVSLVRRPVSILDRVGDGYSTRAAAAAACVGEADPDALERWGARLFAEQPAEGGSGLPDERLVEVAAEEGVDVAACVEEGRYLPWAEATTEQAAEELGRLATPTVVVAGEVVTGAQGGYPSLPELRDAVDAAVDAAGGATDGTSGTEG
ncbi:DsbA family protein [Aquipuribacter sp. SD81]|uniref:DsbA family protein n=1 Tax=Aquipuribacter sp. SD81 TaxID=3127703 RepID=UPI003018AD6C